MHEMLVKLVESRSSRSSCAEDEPAATRAGAQWLGINRNTLRRKLIDHNLA